MTGFGWGEVRMKARAKADPYGMTTKKGNTKTKATADFSTARLTIEL
jgi:hypothetical protein